MRPKKRLKISEIVEILKGILEVSGDLGVMVYDDGSLRDLFTVETGTENQELVVTL